MPWGQHFWSLFKKFHIFKKVHKLILKNYCHRCSSRCYSTSVVPRGNPFSTKFLDAVFGVIVCVSTGNSLYSLQTIFKKQCWRSCDGRCWMKFVEMTCRGTKNGPSWRGGQNASNSAKMTKNWHTCPDNSDVIAKSAKLISLW